MLLRVEGLLFDDVNALSFNSMTQLRVPFTRIYSTGRELDYLREVVESNQLAGDGVFTRRCERWIEQTIGCARALLVHSGTAALDMAAILAEVGPGDEVIVPSFTFPSTANAFVLRGPCRCSSISSPRR